MGIFVEHKQSEEAGFYSFYGRIECYTLCLLFTASLALALSLIGTGSAWEYLALPVALGASVLTSLRYRLRAVLALLAVEVLFVGFFYFAGWGCFAEGVLGYPKLFAFGMVSIFTTVSFVAAIVTGYNLQTASIAVHRQNMLHKIFDSLPIGIWVRARTGETVFVNDRWASFSPMTKEEILASTSQEPPVKLGILWEKAAIDVLDATENPIRYQSIELKDNQGNESSMTLLTLGIFIDQIHDYGTLSLLVDETALRIYEEKVRTSEHSLRLALDNADMGFWDQDLTTRKVSCDANWLRILGLKQSEGDEPLKLWKERLHPDDKERVQDSYRKYFESGEGSMQIDYRVRKGEQEYIWVQDYVGVVERNVDGSIQRIMGTMQDITERKQAEMELKHAKEKAEAANEAKGQFIATISHEIRTPLNAIIGLSSFLSETEMEEDQLDLAQTIYTSGKSLLMLVNDILDFSKIEAGRLDLEVQEYPLHLCFEDCVKLFKVRANEKNVSLELSIDPSLPEFAIGDMERLRQIVQNLLANALKFTEAGSVEICVRPVRLSELPEARRPDPLEPIGYLDQPDHQYLEVLVKDSGIGIPEDRQHVLFEAFSQVDASTTRKYGGTGLGLAICKRLVDAMGGRIWLESSLGEGAVFGFVVRTQLVSEILVNPSVTRSPFDLVDRISEAHPCDILVVGPKDGTERILHSCRRLGYVPHYTPKYDLNSGAFQRRHYNLIFIWMGDEAMALELTRGICAHPTIRKSAAIIGFVPLGQTISKERYKLSGMQEIIEEPARPGVLKDAILAALGVHG